MIRFRGNKGREGRSAERRRKEKKAKSHANRKQLVLSQPHSFQAQRLVRAQRSAHEVLMRWSTGWLSLAKQPIPIIHT